MTPGDARNILGLTPEEDPRPLMEKLRATREHHAARVREAATEALADRYQIELIRFDQALAAIQEPLAAGNPDPPPTPTSALTPPPRKSRRGVGITALLLVIVMAGLGGGWLHLQDLRLKETQRRNRIADLDSQASQFVENRRWQDAEMAYAEIEALSPGANEAILGRRSIQTGMAEEQTQFISYWNGQASAELDAGRFDEADAAARQVLEKYPSHPEAAQILSRIQDARAKSLLLAQISLAKQQTDLRQWDQAIAAAEAILTQHPDNTDAAAILASASSGKNREITDKAHAAEKIRRAVARDHGQFDPEALDWLREAKALDPKHPEIDFLLEKFSNYTRTLRIPGDFPTPAEALAQARPRDRILLSAATWTGPLVIHVPIDLQGDGHETTFMECPPEVGSVITIGPEATGVRISGITFRHNSPAAVGNERFSAALVRGGGVTFTDCHFLQASGHGLAVIESGQASASRCRFADNGWNGVAVIGRNSSVEIRDCQSIDNLQHGIESWDSASVTLTNNRCEGNSLNGIHADNGVSDATITGNQLTANREFGLVLGSAGRGKITGNTASGNLLGGFVIRHAAQTLSFTRNQAILNQGPGITLEIGLTSSRYLDNSLDQNTGPPILSEIDFNTPPENPDPGPPAMPETKENP